MSGLRGEGGGCLSVGAGEELRAGTVEALCWGDVCGDGVGGRRGALLLGALADLTTVTVV